MEAGQVYVFESFEQFWQELNELLNVPADASLDRLDYSCRNYVAFLGHHMDDWLTDPTAFDAALFNLLESELFTSHVDRMTDIIISLLLVDSSDNKPVLFISMLLVLHLGMSNPLSPSKTLFQSKPDAVVSNSKVFKALRRQWDALTPVLKQLVQQSEPTQQLTKWDELLGTTACTVLFEVCRVQKLTRRELDAFDYPFVTRLFELVEKTRDVEDETFNYLLVKLIIALNEQFMVLNSPSSHADTKDRRKSSSSSSGLQAPLEPVIKHDKPDRSNENVVLEILKNGKVESRTFGENVIYILNRSNSAATTNDASLSVSLLILKLLYLLFTTSSTAEYFYTNDLCVLVDVFIRELNDLGPESEGLRHTYLRVLHPLMNNTQLRHYEYKRTHLYKVLKALISHSNYQVCDSTTRRLVERNLKADWCVPLRQADPCAPDLSSSSSASGGSPTKRRSKSSALPIPSSSLTLLDRVDSSVSLNAVADASEHSPNTNAEALLLRRKKRGHTESPHSHSMPTSVSGSPTLSSSLTLAVPLENNHHLVTGRTRSSSVGAALDSSSSGPHSATVRKRRAAPPPPSINTSNLIDTSEYSSALTPSTAAVPASAGGIMGGKRRAAPLPPSATTSSNGLAVGLTNNSSSRPSSPLVVPPSSATHLSSAGNLGAASYSPRRQAPPIPNSKNGTTNLERSFDDLSIR